MLIASIYGRLGADPVERQTRSGKSMTTASVAVNVAGKDAEPATLWVGVLAFNAAAAALLRARKGETVSAMGRLTRGSYTGKDGAEREQWTLLAEAVIVAAPPAEAAKRPSQPEPVQSYDDDIPF